MAGGSLGSIRGSISIDYDGAGIAKAKSDVEGLKKSAAGGGESINRLGTQMAVGGAVIAGGFAVAVRSAANFEKGLSNIKAVSGATSSDMEKVRAKALQLGKDTQFSAAEAAQAFEELAKAGVSLPDIMNGAADATVALAAAAGVDMPTAATIASNAMNQFGLKASDMAGVADTLAGAANASAIDVTDLGQSMAQAGAVAKLSGVSFEDTATAIALLGNAGIKGSDAGTSLKSFLSNLSNVTDGSKKQIAVAEKLNLVTAQGKSVFYDAKGNLKSMADISEILAKSTAGLSEEQKQQALQTLFGSDAIRAAAVLAENGAKGFDTMATSIGKVKAADVAKTKMDNLSGSIEQMKGSAETAAIGLGTAMLPTIKSVVDAATGLINKFTSLSSGTQTTIIQVAAGAAGFLLLGGAIIKTVSFVQNLVASLRAVSAALGLSKVAAIASAAAHRVAAAASAVWTAATNALSLANIKSAASAVAARVAAIATAVAQRAVAIATGAWTAAQWLLNVAMSANPIGLIIIAIIALVAAIVIAYKKSETFRAIVQAVWNAIKVAISASINFIRNLIVAVFNFIKSYLTAVLNGYRAVFSAVWNGIKAVVSGVINGIRAVISAVFNGVRAYLSAVLNGYKAVFSAAWNAIKAVVTGAINTIRSIITRLSSIGSTVSGYFSRMVSGIRSQISAAISVVTGLPGRIRSTVGSFGSILYGAGQSIIRGLINGISSMVGAVKSAVSNVLQSARNLLPFSPAKEGPFSGKGWTLYSGRSIVESLAQGISERSQLLHSAMSNAIGGVAGNINVAASAASSTGLRPAFGGTSTTTTTNLGGVVVNAPQNMNPAEVGQYTLNKLTTALATGAKAR